MDPTPPNLPEHVRLFVAITLPESVKAAVEAAQAELRRSVPRADIRWTSREQFHLTLKFLGNVETGRVESLGAALAQACRPFSPFGARAASVGFFPNERRPRVIWVGVHDRERHLPSMQEAVEASVSGFTHEQREGSFTGHVTLGRIRHLNHSETQSLSNAARSMVDRVFGEWSVDKVELIRSELSSKGARYTTLREAPLQGPLAKECGHDVL